MSKRRLVWLLYPTHLLVALAALAVGGWIALGQYDQQALRGVHDDLLARATFLDAELGPDIPQDRREFARLASRYAAASGIRIALLRPDGKVESDSRNRPEEFENQLGRPEIKQAISSGQPQQFVRYNAALDARTVYLAAPIYRHDRLFGVLYLSRTLTALEQGISNAWIRIFVAAAPIALLALALAWWIARTAARPLAQLRDAALRLAAGQWGTRATLPDNQEMAELAEAFNRLAGQLQQRVSLLIRNNNEQQAVLASMAEGVLAVDNQERVISLNSASGRLLGLDPAQAQGRRLQEVVRNADLSRFVSRALACQEPIQADVLLHGDRERVMQAHGSALHDVDGRATGAVIVLNDVTDFRRLEHIRRDFVANVSHELKTPVTSIKGFVETLLDGAVRDPVDSDRFLRIIAKQADRLHAIIEDLLSLSKIEQSEDAEAIVLETAPLRPVLESALIACQTNAEDRQIKPMLECDAALTAKMNPLLLEQAVVNLLDNAIKYSEPGREVRLSATLENGEVAIRVADRGSGIAQEHLDRIFERFYRVDRARSRKLGGTGLGLAIVKHIVQAHHGRVTVDSTLGVGSTFTIFLPHV